jgi:anti-anti-sigma regulatory factor
MSASSSVPSTCHCFVSPPVPGTNHSVVWLRREHDSSTREALVATLARAIALNESALIIDLTEVRMMSAATIGVIARAEEFVRHRGRSFVLRASSACIESATEWGGLGVAVVGAEGPEPDPVENMSEAQALGSWVEVPVADPVSWQHEFAEAPSNDPRQTSGAAGGPGTDAFREDSLTCTPPISETAGERH